LAFGSLNSCRRTYTDGFSAGSHFPRFEQYDLPSKVSLLPSVSCDNFVVPVHLGGLLLSTTLAPILTPTPAGRTPLDAAAGRALDAQYTIY
jgi:hypothetical protein